MTVIALTASRIAPVFPGKADIIDMLAAATITAGQIVYQDSNGRAAVADANAAGLQQARGIALNGGGAGQTISVLRRGEVTGFTISQAYDARVYLSDTAGAVDDAAGTMTVPIGRVRGLSDNDRTKVIMFDFSVIDTWA